MKNLGAVMITGTIENFLRWLANLELGWQILLSVILYLLIFGRKIIEVIKKRSVKNYFD